MQLKGRVPFRHYNEARMMLLSKEPTPIPPIGRIRPIQMYTPLTKAAEAVCDWIDGNIIWFQTLQNQYGARPGAKMANLTKWAHLCTINGTYPVMWFIDFSDAFNTVH